MLHAAPPGEDDRANLAAGGRESSLTRDLVARALCGYSVLKSLVAQADTVTVPSAQHAGKESGGFLKMLVLTRKLGENIRIGDSVKITVLEVRSGQVKLGIEAPPEVKVHREEIYARIQEENRRARVGKPGEPGVSGAPGADEK